jgi:transcriptional regulator NrdR family protein
MCQCGVAQTAVIDSRRTATALAIRRRRKCLQCGARFTTYECREHPTVAVARLEKTRESIGDLLDELRAEVFQVPRRLAATSES